MAGAGSKIHFLELLQLPNAFERGCTERSLAVEGVQHNPFQQVAKRDVVVFGKSFQDFENSFLDAHARLHALDQQLGVVRHLCTKVPWYQKDCKQDFPSSKVVSYPTQQMFFISGI